MHEPRARPASVSAAWAAYYEKTGNRPPRETLIRALDAFEGEPAGLRRAVDLGSGTGRDTVEMLRRGWTVLAIDAEKAAVEQLAAREDLPSAGRLETRTGRFEALRWPVVELVNSRLRPPALPARLVPGAVVAHRRIARPGRALRGPALRRPGRVVRRPVDHLPRRPRGRCAARRLRGRASQRGGGRQRHPARTAQALAHLPHRRPEEGLTPARWFGEGRLSRGCPTSGSDA